MGTIPPLETLGPRIVICGPSNAGKSTLARAIGRKLRVPVSYLDLLWHLPHTDWQPRPSEEFARLHAEAVAGDSWVMEGNYFASIGPRLERATGIVLLGSRPWRGYLRYLRRTLLGRKDRAGQLDGGIDRLNWRMTRYLLLEQPKKAARNREILKASGLPMVEAGEIAELKRLYEAWGLSR